MRIRTLAVLLAAILVTTLGPAAGATSLSDPDDLAGKLDLATLSGTKSEDAAP